MEKVTVKFVRFITSALFISWLIPQNIFATTPFQLTSSAFKDQKMIPKTYSCDNKNISPPLQWSNPPFGTRSFALIVSDPDASSGIWYHWIVINIPSDVRSLTENAGSLPASANIAENSWGNRQYNGPCPPAGMHHYVFTLYALNTMLPPELGQDLTEIVNAIRSHMLVSATLIGTYSR